MHGSIQFCALFKREDEYNIIVRRILAEDCHFISSGIRVELDKVADHEAINILTREEFVATFNIFRSGSGVEANYNFLDFVPIFLVICTIIVFKNVQPW